MRLNEELVTKTYRRAPYRTFTLFEGKTRRVSATPFRDRVVQHAVIGVLDPIFERPFIHDSHARPERTHAALNRCQACASHFRYVLKA